TAGRWPPLIDTRPTPGSCEIFWARLVSARSSTRLRGKLSEGRARVRIGVSAGLTLLEMGGVGRSRGGEVAAAVIAARPSLSATVVEGSRGDRSGESEAPKVRLPAH